MVSYSHKKGDKLTISKLFEIVLKARILSILNKYTMINFIKLVFRVGKYTEDVLLSYVSEIYYGFDQRKSCAGLFMDIKKCFDIVNNTLLMKKLYLVVF